MNQRLDGNPWLKMWTKPKQTIERIIQKDSRYGFTLLSLFYGIVQGVHIAQGLSLSTMYSFWINVALIVLLAIPMGALYFAVASFFFYLVGKLIGGKASYLEIRAAISWSNVTQIGSFILVVMMVAIFQNQFFYRSFIDQTFAGWALALVCLFLIAQVILSIWTFVLFVAAIAQVQRYSIWMALLNVLLVTVIYFILIFLLEKILTTSVSGNNLGILWGSL